MKDPTTWDESDLLQLIQTKQEEHLQLEFKGAIALGDSDGKKTEISKDVSAFANSAGGTLLYGMDEQSDEPNYAKALSPINPASFSKEWLEQVINSRIHPRVERMVVNPVELRTKHPGEFAYVVWIPESATAHQASDKKYYKRFNFQSVPMEDYEIRQAMNRASGPVYSIRLGLQPEPGSAGAARFCFRAVVQNESYVVGKDVSAVIFVPPHLVERPDQSRYPIAGIECCRIAGTHPVAPVWEGSVIPSAPPFTPHVMRFHTPVQINATGLALNPLKVWVQVYDHLGLALMAKFQFFRLDAQIEPVEVTHAAKRARSSFPIAG